MKVTTKKIFQFELDTEETKELLTMLESCKDSIDYFDHSTLVVVDNLYDLLTKVIS